MALPRFKNIQIYHEDGWDPKTVLAKVLDFINHPDHKNYKYIDSHVNYFHPPHPQTPMSDDPEECMWVEVTILYQE